MARSSQALVLGWQQPRSMRSIARYRLPHGSGCIAPSSVLRRGR